MGVSIRIYGETYSKYEFLFTMIFMDACKLIVASNITAFCFGTNDEMRQRT
jgi:hypothetical protein